MGYKKTIGVTIKPNLTHSGGRLNSIEKLNAINPDRKAPACFVLSSPVVKGLALVRATCLSMSRSVKSLMMHPADLQPMAPAVKRAIVFKGGISVGEPSMIPQ